MPAALRLLLPACLLLLALPAPAAQTLERIVAVVNDEVVLASELERELEGVRRQLAERDTRPPPEEDLRRQVLERLIMRRLQLDLAQRSGVRVDEATLDEAVRRIAERNNLGLSEFRDALAAEGIGFATFRDQIRQEITLTRLRQREMQRRINITPQEIDQFLEQQGDEAGQRYRLRHILVALPEAASPEQLQQAGQRAEALMQALKDGARFAALAARYSDSQTALEGGDIGWRAAGELPRSVAEVLPRLQPGQVTPPVRTSSGVHLFQLVERRDESRRMVTQTRARHILIETNEVVTNRDAAARLRSLRERVLNGDDFAELARAHSDDKGSASAGGDLGWRSPGSFVPVFEQAMQDLAPGQISRPFESPFGWHIVQVLERRRHDSTEEFQRTQAAQQIRERKQREETELWLRQLREEAYVDIRLAS